MTYGLTIPLIRPLLPDRSGILGVSKWGEKRFAPLRSRRCTRTPSLTLFRSQQQQQTLIPNETNDTNREKWHIDRVSHVRKMMYCSIGEPERTCDAVSMSYRMEMQNEWI
ncbi:uncharacterized protein LOC131696202 [Topomyia yanbarensis]|uniref:uncharacterized protein LOC131696202 n=1 Tax=Topomyia yanbarensis TaxID=2498891 RepID=UPI00273C6754|nr:uncharacterized protein LOC131696202 [Topomyia yanbarensis]